MSGRLIGEAYISLLADASMFPADAKAKVDAALKGIKGEIPLTANSKDADAKIAGLVAKLKGLSGSVRVTADTRAFIKDIATAETAVLTLMDRLDNMTVDANNSKFMAKMFSTKSVVDGLAEQLDNMDADGDMNKLISKIYGAKAVVEGLETEMSHLDADVDIAKVEAKFGILGAQVKALAGELDGLRADATDSALLAKITSAQSVVLKLAKSMRNLPLTADTLPLEADIYKAMALVEALRKQAHGVQIASYPLPGGGVKGTSPFEYGTAGATGKMNNSEAQFMDNLTMHTLAAMTAVRHLNVDLANIAPSLGMAATALGVLSRGQSMIIANGTGWGAWRNQIRLFGGALDSVLPKWAKAISLWHLGLDVAFEFAAAWAPALIAVGAFAAYAIPVGEKIAGQWKNINTILDGVGGTLPDLGSQFDTIEKHIEPSVLIAFGEYMQVIGKNGQALGTVLAGVGKVVDVWGAALVDWSTKATKSFDNLVHSGTGDFALIGEGFHQLFRIIGDLIKDMPGIVHVLLPLGDAFLKTTAAAIEFLGPLLKIGLLIHGVLIYAGLAITAVVALGRAMSTAALSTFFAKTTGFTVAGEDAAAATGKFNKLGGAIGTTAGLIAAGAVNTFKYGKDVAGVAKGAGLAAAGTKILGDAVALVPFGAAGLVAGGLAAVIGIGLYLAIKHTTDATVVLAAKLQALVAGSNVTNIGKNLTFAIAKTQQQLNLSLSTGTNAQQQYNKAVSSIPVNVSDAQANAVKNILKQQKQLTAAQQSGYAAAAKANPTGVYAQLTAVQQKAIGEADTYGMRMNALTGIFGSNSGALAALNLVGISAGQIATEGTKAWQNQYTQLIALAKGYGYMGTQAGAAGAQLNALNLVSGTTYKNIQALTQAETQWVNTVTGGESAFTTFEQGFANLNGAIGKSAKNAPAVSVTLGKLTEKFTAVGATMKGTSAASLATRQAFDQQLTAGVGLYGNLQMLAGASGNTAKSQGQLAKSGKDIIAQLLPFAAGSKQATAEVSSLAQLMGGPATSNFKTLAKWVGNTKGAMGDLNNQQASLTISASNLTTAERNLGNTLETSVTQAQAAAIAKTVNLTGATQNLASAATNAKDKMTAQALLAAGQYVNSLERAGLSNKDATQYLNAYLGRLGYAPSVIKTLDGALDDSKTKFEKVAGSMGLSKAAADKLYASLQNLKNGSPYNVKVGDTISGQGGIVAKANIPGQPALSARLNFSAAAHGLAAGGVVRGGVHGIDSVPAMLAPGELVVPASHAPAFGSMAKRAGIPGMASGGFVNAANSQAGTIGNVLPFDTSTASKFSAEATSAFAQAMSKSVQNSLNQSVASTGGSGALTGGNASGLLGIARYLMTQGLSKAAAAGVASVISGESGGNPESRQQGGTGWGLIQWTGNTVGLPAGYSGITGNVQRDMAAQLAGVIGYIRSRGGIGAINAAGNPVAAGDVFSRYEAPAVPLSDTRPGIADQIFAMLSGGSAAGAAQGSNTISAHTAKRHSAGGMVSEPVYGIGAHSGKPYSFAENGRPEYVGPLSGNQGQGGAGMQPMTNTQGQQANAQLAMLVKLLQQLPTTLGKAVATGAGNGVRHGYYKGQN